MERVVSHRSEQHMTATIRKRLFRLQRLSRSRSWHQNVVDCHEEKDSTKETLRGPKGSGQVSQRQPPSTSLGPKSGTMGARTIRWLEPTKRSETSLLLEIQGLSWDLVPNAPRRGRRKKHLTPTPSLPPAHKNPTDDKSSRPSDSSSSSSSSTQAPSGIPQHANDQAQAQDNS